MATLFISDLHLDPERPDILQQFLRLVEHATTAEALYILGDFVEYWIGDDDTEHGLETAFAGLQELTESGTPVYLMHGNRDFLIGKKFADKYRVQLIPDPLVIDLYGTPTLLIHGDTLCTDDVEYQKFREAVRTPQWQTEFLNKPLAERRTIVKQLRATSQSANSVKTDAIMDVNGQAVAKAMLKHGVQQLIHGHTHRPDIHRFTLNNQRATRIVLGDWYQTGSFLSVDASGLDVHSLN